MRDIISICDKLKIAGKKLANDLNRPDILY